VHAGALAWNGFKVFGMIYWLLLRLFKQKCIPINWPIFISGLELWDNNTVTNVASLDFHASVNKTIKPTAEV
jgi:cbb3-type cytochrome oxidase subunit 1